jgi:uncharacterized OB-fold protein
MSWDKPVKSISTPTRLEYDFTAVGAQAEFLENIAKGVLIGKRCPECHKVYVPARGNCPRCGIATTESVEVSDRGTVTTFCVVRVPSKNIEIELPYVAAQILLDGADMAFHSLLQECAVEDVRMGMRVEAVWAPREEWGPTFENIRYFRPTGEPDLPYDQYKEHA